MSAYGAASQVVIGGSRLGRHRGKRDGLPGQEVLSPEWFDRLHKLNSRQLPEIAYLERVNDPVVGMLPVPLQLSLGVESSESDCHRSARKLLKAAVELAAEFDTLEEGSRADVVDQVLHVLPGGLSAGKYGVVASSLINKGKGSLVKAMDAVVDAFDAWEIAFRMRLHRSELLQVEPALTSVEAVIHLFRGSQTGPRLKNLFALKRMPERDFELAKLSPDPSATQPLGFSSL